MKAATLGVLVLSVALALPSAARAQAAATTDEGAAHARELFAQGVALAGEHHYADAATRFRQALALRDAPTIRYNLASTLFEEQQYTEAHELATALLAQADLPDSVRAPTEALEAQIANAAALVTFGVPEGVAAEVLVDDVPIADPTHTTALAPGHHTARAVASGATIAHEAFDVIAAEHRTVELDVEATETAEPAPAASVAVTDEAWFWPVVIGGSLLVVLAVGIGVGVAVDQGGHTPITGNFTPGILSW